MKKILITGASRGIGRSLALKLSAIENSQIVVVSRNMNALKEIKEIAESRNRRTCVHVVPADFTREEEILEMTRIVKEKLGVIDAIVNNAGYLAKGDFEQLSADDIRRSFMVNYTAPALIIRELAEILRRSESPHIVNISSMGGFQGSSKFPGLSHYSSSKAAISSLTECLAEEFKGSIKVNCLAIGAVQTEMLAEAFPGFDAPLSSDEMADYIGDFTLKAHKYMNGKIIPVALSGI